MANPQPHTASETARPPDMKSAAIPVPLTSSVAQTQTHYHITFPPDMDRWTDKQRWDFWINLGTTLSVAGSRSSPAITAEAKAVPASPVHQAVPPRPATSGEPKTPKKQPATSQPEPGKGMSQPAPGKGKSQPVPGTGKSQPAPGKNQRKKKKREQRRKNLAVAAPTSTTAPGSLSTKS